jgi:hypothetical protein
MRATLRLIVLRSLLALVQLADEILLAGDGTTGKTVWMVSFFGPLFAKSPKLMRA